MNNHDIVSHEQWITARKQLLAKEKEFNHMRDALSQARRDLPWERVDKQYKFNGEGEESLSDLFAGKSQLVVYHFMFDPTWEAGCKSCSFWADNFNGIDIHLQHRDISFLAISRAPYNKIDAYKKRMGWTFKWISSFGNDFNFDYGVSFKPDQLSDSSRDYNYDTQRPYGSETPGISVFYKDPYGSIFHTYSCYSRGLDMLNGAYHYIDLTPKGRDEGGGSGPQFWVRRHDEY